MMSEMTRVLVQVLVAVFAVGSVTKGDPSSLSPPCSMRRECRKLGTKDGATTVAVEMYVGRYDRTNWSGDSRTACRTLDPLERYRVPECVVVEEFDARRMGDLDGRAELAEAGYNRDRTRSRITATASELRQMLMPFSEVRFAFKASWDDYIMIFYLMHGESQEFLWTVDLKWAGERYWLTEEITLNHMIHPLLSAYLTGDGAPLCGSETMNTPLRISLDPTSPQEKRRIRLDPLTEGLPDESRGAVVYLQVEDEAQPDGRAVASIPSGDAVGGALSTAISVYTSGESDVRRLLDVWDLESREGVTNVLKRFEGTKFPLVESFPLGRHADKFLVTAKIATDDGTMVYGRGPRGMGEIRPAAIALRERDGQYRLAHKLPNTSINQILTDPALVEYLARAKNNTR